jgi:hypothetical protein
MGTAPTAAEIAWSMAGDTDVKVQDCMVLIGYLAERVQHLEMGLDAPLQDMSLPSEMTGFACIPRRDEAVRRALERVIDAMKGEG